MKPFQYLMLFLALAMLLIPATAVAQSGGDYDLTWSTIDGGGGASSGGDYTLVGAIGQVDAGAVNGGDYAVDGGFWGSSLVLHNIFLPLVLRNPV